MMYTYMLHHPKLKTINKNNELVPKNKVSDMDVLMLHTSSVLQQRSSEQSSRWNSRLVSPI